MKAQLPWKWYIKPVLPIVLAGTALFCAFFLFLPDPYFSLLHDGYRLISLQSGVYLMLLLVLSMVYQAAVWLVLFRCWRFHQSQGLPLAKHAAPMVISALFGVLPVALMPALLVATGLRSGVQDMMESPWFPLLRHAEVGFCLYWLAFHSLLFVGWLAVWARWRSRGCDGLTTVFVCALGHLLALVSFVESRWVGENEFGFKLIGLFLLVVLVVFVPMRAQLNDTEAL